MRKAYSELKKQGIKGLVIDLRDNPGGLLIESVDIDNMFVEKGNEVVSTRGKYSKFDTKYTTLQPALDTAIPLAVLISRGSASASEIVSGSLQDLDRAVIIGQKSFGKGLVQTTRELSYNSKLKVTTAKYYTPSGRCIQALDYSHRNEDGSVGKVPDSLIRAYKTKNGRTVYDGGGIDPDIKIEEHEMSVLSYELMVKNLIFNFVTEYAQKHPTIASAQEFTVDDATFEEFKAYVRKSGFSYKLDSEEKLSELIDAAKKENYHGEIGDQISALQTALNESKKGDLDKHKEEISKLLASEIVGRYYYQRGQIMCQLRDDEALTKAIETLKDGKKYREILQVKK
jgi:carboxyl-terminal processing protease